MKQSLFVLILALGIFLAPSICQAKENAQEPPIYGSNVKDGTYEVEMTSSSSMFRIVKAELNVSDGDMAVVITLSGTGYLKLFMGTGEKALTSSEESFIPYVENEEGAYTYTIGVEALNQEFDCAAYSKRKEKWYDRKLSVAASSLPQEAFRLKDGKYEMEVTLKGGSGRAAVTSPSQIEVSKGALTALVEWSSPDYDYMIVGGVKYLPVNTKGNSVFAFPVPALDKEIDVTADTVAMSKPHEIAYTLTFHSDTVVKEHGAGSNVIAAAAAGIALAAIAGIVLAVVYKRKKQV